MLDFELYKSYSSRNRDANIYCRAQIVNGSTSAIYGRSGVGKSTILRTIAGLEIPDKGIITKDGRLWFDTESNTNLPISQRRVGFVFQDFNLFPNMTIKGNLAYASNQRTPPDAVMKLLASTDLAEHLNSYPAVLSGGERQRVAVIRSLCQQPDLLLLDEPFSALDDESIGTLIKEIRLIQNTLNTTVVLVSHRKDTIFEMADSVIHMKSPTEVVQGAPNDLLSRHF